jgi:hypothetical protein
VTAARQLWCAALAALGTLMGTVLPALLGPGCASAPDPLRVAIVANNAAVVSLREAQAQHGARLTAAYLARVSLCPSEPPEARRGCVVQAGQDALAALAPERVRLLELELAQHAVATALEQAQACREGRDSCTTSEASALAGAAGPAARLRQALEQDGGAP